MMITIIDNEIFPLQNKSTVLVTNIDLFSIISCILSCFLLFVYMSDALRMPQFLGLWSSYFTVLNMFFIGEIKKLNMKTLKLPSRLDTLLFYELHWNNVLVFLSLKKILFLFFSILKYGFIFVPGSIRGNSIR